MSGSQDRWLLLHGTPLTPAVWDGVAACLTRSGTVLVSGHHPGRRCPRRSGRAGRPAHRRGSPAGRPPARRRPLLRRAGRPRLHAPCPAAGRDPDPAVQPGHPVPGLRRRRHPAARRRPGRRRRRAQPVVHPGRAGPGRPGRQLRAPLRAPSGPPVVGGCAGCHRPVRPGRPHRLHPDPGHAHRSRTRPGVHSGGHVSPGQPPAQGYPADPARRRAHDTLHRSSRPGRAHPPRRRAMMASFPAPPLRTSSSHNWPWCFSPHDVIRRACGPARPYGWCGPSGRRGRARPGPGHRDPRCHRH